MNVFVPRIILILFSILQSTVQNCPEEISNSGISVTWHQTPTANNIESDPLCYRNETLVMRNCSNAGWIPSLDNIGPCLKVVKYFDINSCPPGYHKISENNNDYCYQIGEPSAWNSPCFASGGASVITDLSAAEIEYLLTSLKATNTSRYFWLPAIRQKLFHPVVWTIPGPNWGQRVEGNDFLSIFASFASFTKNCLLLDIELGMLLTEACTKIYPSLCFYINDLYYPTQCPDGYHSFRFKLDNGTCYGIEQSEQAMSYHDFIKERCPKPMHHSEYELTRFIFKKISEISQLPNDVWCWFKAFNESYAIDKSGKEYQRGNAPFNTEESPFEGIINNAGVLGLINSSLALSCMACEMEVIYGKTELMFEYDEVLQRIFLTVYYPSGLWKYDSNDKGIQCFSDAKGFVKVVDVNDIPFIETKSLQEEIDFGQIEKIVYIIDLVTDSSAQYWCEGHTINFSFIATEKIVANPKGNKVHVFALVIKHYVLPDDIEDLDNLTDLITNITNIFSANKVLLMDIFDYSLDHMKILLHLHVDIEDVHQDESLNIQDTFASLQHKASVELPKYNYTFVNLSSSIYCLPTTSGNVIELDWEMTLIGHMTAPKQFCLQANGLPVKRRCIGSYVLGGMWGNVEGSCDSTYEPSNTTAFLYSFVKRQMPDNYVSRFLTDGLNFVFADTDIIIPADIYYLSMSLQNVLDVAQENATSIDTGDIDNIAWVMDRMMILDYNYLRLAQTLNSTNVILDSKLGSEGVTHVLCTSGCGVRPGAPIISHSVDGPYELIGIAAGGAPCNRRSMRKRLNNEPPLYIDVYPYITWIMNVITAYHLPKPYPQNFMQVEAGPSLGINKSFLRKRKRQKSGWRARTYMSGSFCYKSMRKQKHAAFFYSEKFEVNADPPAKLNVIMKISAGIECTIVCARLMMPNRLSVPEITGVGGYNITIVFDTEWFPYTFYFALALDGKNTTASDFQTWLPERKAGFW
uniref:Peptidase S1 domain-containing protein n=1 Tax=Heliothis virescens TaxID=7102 RepID=A0A2A4K1I3_HELVI